MCLRSVRYANLVFSFFLFSLFTFPTFAEKVKSWPVQTPAPVPLSGEFNGDLSRVPFIPQVEINEIPEPKGPEPNFNKQPLPGADQQISTEGVSSIINMPSPIQNFSGLDFNNWGAGWPPDTVGDVGPNHFIQAVNTSIGIYNKTGTQLAAFTFNTLWNGAGSGTVCDNTNRGDPTVVYDPLADRWIVADFAFTGGGTTPPFYECVAVSKTGDPVNGGWWLYAIRADDAGHPWLPDYPKMGVWPDGIYMTANMFDSSFNYKGVRVFAFNRTDLESGATVRMVIVDISNTNYFSLMPSNLRGTSPPAGRENLLVSESNTAFAFEVWKFHVDYIGGGSTFTGPTNVSQTSYTVAAATVPTPQNSLDSLRERIMMQNQYRNIAGTESLWVNHTVRTPSSGPTGIQWAQINVTGGTIVTTPVQQQIFGNLSSDGIHRWMGSLGVDKDGNMAIGYSAANASNNPSIRYDGRLATDPAGTLSQGEATLISGGGSQQGNCGGGVCQRWGDYSAMSVDPTDDCTFWYTTEYYASNGLNWQTRIGSFKFPSCGASCPTITFTTTSVNPSCNGGSDGSITVSASGGVPPYSYSKDNGANYQASNVFTGLAAGTYNVIVKDSNNCTSAASPVSLTNPPAITFTTTKVDPACPGNSNGTITVNASGGTGTLVYSKDNGVNYQASNVFNGLSAGTYNIVVKDANNCTTAASPVTLNDPVPISFTTTKVDPACPGNSNGAITVNASGGTGTLMYSKDNGVNYQASNVFNGLSAGTYNIVVKDANNCTTAASPVTLNDPIPISFTTTKVDPTCPSTADGSITVNASGGTGTLMYSKDNGVNFQASNVFNGLADGAYNIVVKDANNCTTAATPVTLTSSGVAPSVTLDPLDQSVNAGASVSFTAAANGNPAPTVQWQVSTDGGANFTDLAGETNTTLTFIANITDDGNQYRAVFTNPCGSATTLAANLTVTAGSCLFCDDFEDAILSPNWTYIKPTWTEPAGGSLIGSPVKKKAITIATPVFTGCSNCYVESTMMTAGGIGNRVWMLGWYVDKKNTVELMMKEENDKWVLKERINGAIVAKTKMISVINPNTFYRARITFDGTQFQVFIDGNLLMSLNAVGPHNGTVGFEAKGTVASFGEIIVN